MITGPFQLLRQFQDILDVRFLARADNVSSDADIARITGKKNIASLRQMHGNTAVRVNAASSRMLEADALATDTPGLTLTIRFADCQNALILHPKKRVVCLLHAGWRGVQSRVMIEAYEMLRAEWGIDPEETFVGLGPSLCTKCAEFTDPLTEAPELKDFIRGRCIDLRAALDDELAGIGVHKNRIERMPDCTRCHPETYFTYRGGDRDAVQNGYINALAVTIIAK